MTAQDVMNAVSSDMRQVLSASAPDNAIILPWVDRIQKDVLHTSLFNALLRKTTQITVVQDTPVYTLSDSSVRRIVSVYDRTFDRFLLPYETVSFPTPKADAEGAQPQSMPEPMLSASTMLQWPAYFLREGTNTIHLFPAPQKAAFGGTYEVYYETYAPSVAASTDTLLVPDDGKDLVVAGVNMLASQYLKNPEDTQYWTNQYELMKTGAFRG
jgi:hypothetical protein